MPDSPDSLFGPTLRERFAACLAEVLGVPGDEVPRPDGPSPLKAWSVWLAARGLGLVPIQGPAEFAWPGYWIAVGREPGGERGAFVMFGVPAGVVFDPTREEPGDVAIELGFAVGPLDLHPRAPVGAATSGTVDAILVAAEATGPMVARDRVHASAAGLEGDRYVRGEGTFSRPGATGVALTLIEREALDEVVLRDGSRIRAEDARRNVVTRGVRLEALVGRRFLLGDAECYGSRPCEPCAHLQRLTRPGVLRAFVHRGGLRADVIRPGEIAVGARVQPL